MKRTTIILSLIFALAIALSVSIPTLADASDTGTTVISGTLGGHIDITANTSDLSLPDLIPDQRVVTTDNASVSVKCNKAGWTLTVQEYGAGADQKMSSSTDTAYNSLQVRGGDITSWTNIGPAAALENGGAKYSDTHAVTTINNIQFGQTADYEDDAGVYTITVLFTASAN